MYRSIPYVCGKHYFIHRQRRKEDKELYNVGTSSLLRPDTSGQSSEALLWWKTCESLSSTSHPKDLKNRKKAKRSPVSQTTISGHCSMYFLQYNLLDAHFGSSSLKAHDIPFLWFDMPIILAVCESTYIQTKSQAVSKKVKRPNFYQLFHINDRCKKSQGFPSVRCVHGKQSKNVL